MSRKLASIQEIIKIEPIEGADRIEQNLYSLNASAGYCP